LTINRDSLFLVFKYTVYVLLAMNIYWFYAEESAAAVLQFSNGLDASRFIEAYSATIDTAAWVVLLLLFELETYVLDDRHFTRPVALSLHGLRAVCYAVIVYAFFGYVANLNFHYAMRILDDVSSACALLPEAWSWAVTLDEYAEITAANCGSLAAGGPLFQFDEMQAVVDQAGLTEIRRLAWVDVINSAVWLLVVLVLEIDVRLQEHDRLHGLALRASTGVKSVLYSALLLAAIYWGVKGDFVDFWDAFLWLIAFVFIELNIFEWRQEELEASSR
jgi:hypothetical protein